LPTQADLANLRSGDVYRDTTAGNVLKIKVWPQSLKLNILAM
jgi:hypothetical protein